VKIKAVLFDIDNTLYDTKALVVASRRNAIKAMVEAGFEADIEEAFRKLNDIVKHYGPNYDQHYDRLLEAYGSKPNPHIIAAGIIAYHNTKVAYLVPYADTIPALLKLKEKNIKLGVVTDGLPVKQWEKLIRLGIQHFFDTVIISENYQTTKPDIKLFKEALKKLSVKPSQTMMVGDRVDKDISGANKAGLVSVQILHPDLKERKPKEEYEYPRYVIGELKELLEIL
jgi:putative hydrolase of the HAD superfamily